VNTQNPKAARTETNDRECQRPWKETDADVTIIDNSVDRDPYASNDHTDQRRPTSETGINVKPDSPTTQHET